MLRFEGKTAAGFADQFEQAHKECCEALRTAYGNSTGFQEQVIYVTYNSRLRTTAGKVGWKPGLQAWKLDLNPKYHAEFGMDRALQTFRHELAHIADWVNHKNMGHSKTFKRICSMFGGSMNFKMAGTQYQENASRQYLGAKRGYLYTCPGCNQEYKRARVFTHRQATTGLCGVCRTPAGKFKLEHLI